MRAVDRSGPDRMWGPERNPLPEPGMGEDVPVLTPCMEVASLDAAEAGGIANAAAVG